MGTTWGTIRGFSSYLRVLYDEVSRREDESYQRSREKHLDFRDVSVIATEDLGEGVGMVYTESFRGALMQLVVSNGADHGLRSLACFHRAS